MLRTEKKYCGKEVGTIVVLADVGTIPTTTKKGRSSLIFLFHSIQLESVHPCMSPFQQPLNHREHDVQMTPEKRINTMKSYLMYIFCK
jgi:hypothetical protein